MIKRALTELLIRDSEVPLYSPNGLAITKKGMCNTTRVRDLDGTIHDYIRAIGTDNLSRVMHAVEGKVLPKPVLEPSIDAKIPDRLGCEDPHAITRINPKTGFLEVIMLYVGYDGPNKNGNDNSIILAKSNDFYNFNKVGAIDNGGVPDKDCVPFDHDGRLYIFRRPMYKGTDKWGIVVSELDLDSLTVKDIGEIRPEQEWEQMRIGAGFAFKMGDKIMLGYHGVNEEDNVIVYRDGLMLLALNDPSKVLYRTRDPVFVPRTDDERYGFKESGQAQKGERKEIVIFTGYDDNDGRFTAVYGAGDKNTRTASNDLKTVKEYVATGRNRAA